MMVMLAEEIHFQTKCKEVIRDLIYQHQDCAEFSWTSYKIVTKQCRKLEDLAGTMSPPTAL